MTKKSLFRLQTFIRDLIIDSIVWPKVLNIPFWDQELYNLEELIFPIEETSKSISEEIPNKISVKAGSLFGPCVVSLNIGKIQVFYARADQVENDWYCVVYLQEQSITSPSCRGSGHDESNSSCSLTQRYKTELRKIELIPNQSEIDGATGISVGCNFDERYEFYWSRNSCSFLEIEVWLHNRFTSDEFLGSASINIGSLAAKKV